MNEPKAGIKITPLPDFPDVTAGEDLAQLIGEGLKNASLAVTGRDVIVVAQKIVSKAEGRKIDLATVTPSARAVELGGITRKDPRLVELILSESSDVLRAIPDVLIVRHRRGYVMANAGIDRSNVGATDGKDWALLLPVDPDGSAAKIRRGLEASLGIAPGVIISDSFGRPWRLGTVNVAIGAAGIATLIDRRGETDRYGRRLEVTEVAFADGIAAAAGLAMGEAAEGRPVVHISGLEWGGTAQNAGALIRPVTGDLFR